MTTIAWDGTRLAADKKRSVHGTAMPCTKIWRFQGQLYGAAGDSWDCVAVRDWIEGRVDKPVVTNLSVLRIDTERRAWLMEEKLSWHEITLPTWVLGSGGEYAMGAMAAGKNAIDAVEIANVLDNGSGLGVDWLMWERHEPA